MTQSPRSLRARATGERGRLSYAAAARLKETARRLHIELPTVKSHVHNILEKLRVGSRTEAAARLLWRRLENLTDRQPA